MADNVYLFQTEYNFKEYSFLDEPIDRPFLYLIFNVSTGIQAFTRENITGVLKIISRRSERSQDGIVIPYCVILTNPQVTSLERFYYQDKPELTFNRLTSADTIVCYVRDRFPDNDILKQMDDKLVAVTFLKMLQNFIGREGKQLHTDILFDLFQLEIDSIETT